MSDQLWKCRKCGWEHRPAIRSTQIEHPCPKNKGQNMGLDLIEGELPEKKGSTPCPRTKTPVSLNTPSNNQQESREDNQQMARATPATEETPKTKARKSTAKEKAPKATKAAKATPAAENGDGEKKGRRNMGERGWLATAIDGVLRANPGETHTVNSLASAITNAAGEHPSSGAVAAALLRWEEQGYVVLRKERPMTFVKFQGKWKNKSLEDFLADQREQRAAARAAAKASA